MKEKPILFNGEEVRAILEGRKTQTRRVVKTSTAVGGEKLAHFGKFITLSDLFDPGLINKKGTTFGCEVAKHAPLGQPGDRLWVRETWMLEKENGVATGGFIYRATDKPETDIGKLKWKPSIHMPRWASRLTLEITGVRVELLHDITQEDIRSEGCGPIIGFPEMSDEQWANGFLNCWIDLWDSTTKPGSKWDNNPWVWVYDFKVVIND